jgi:dGTPase
VADPYDRFFVRYRAETGGDARSPVEKDRDRIIHASAFRRLQGKSQIFGVGLTDFFRTRLTHSLECAQIGGGIAERVKSKHWSDVVEKEADFTPLVQAACLAHDLGHPPFGHNGERALRKKMKEYNGTLFEGNAQSFRIVTAIEPKEFGRTRNGTDRWVGLNLTRATLKAMTKYPWGEDDGRTYHRGRLKFGLFREPADEEYFEWVWDTERPQRTIATSVMDVADDIAYATHDFEDGVWAEMIPLHLLVRADPAACMTLQNKVLSLDRDRDLRAFPDDDIAKPLASLLGRIKEQTWAQRPFERTRVNRRLLKRYVTDLIDYFIRATTPDGVFTPPAGVIRQHLDLLTGMARAWMIDRPDLETQQYAQREMIEAIFDGYWTEPRMLPRRDEWELIAADTSSRRTGWRRRKVWPEKARIICDHIAGMTDAYAARVYAAMHQGVQAVELRWTY